MSNDDMAQGRSPEFVPIADVRRDDWMSVQDFFDRDVFVRVASIVKPDRADTVMWRVWVAPVYRGDEVVSSMSFDTCEEVEVWR